MNDQPGDYIKIDGKVYFLGRNDAGAPVWESDQVRTQDGDPTSPRWWRWDDWSRGMGDSRGLVRGAVEYAENAFLGAMGRLLPPPNITEITGSLGAEVTCFTEVVAPANRVLAGGGSKIIEINPATQAVAATRTVGGGSVLSMALFIDHVAIALGDSQNFEYRNASGTYAANTLSLKARAFGIDNGKLVRGRSYFWSSCDAANFYSVSNWSAEFDIGNKAGSINAVFSHNRWSYILKDEGLYTYDEQANEEANVLGDLQQWKSAENRSYGLWGDLLFVPTIAGLYRYLQQGAGRPVGIEEIPINESELSGQVYPTAFAAFGKWGYVSYYKAATNTSYLCLVGRAQEGDVSGLRGSPFTVVSVLDKFTGKCQAMHISHLPGSPTLYYGRTSGNVGYFTITRDGLPAAYETAFTTTVRFSPTALGAPLTVKHFRSIEFYGRNLSTNSTLQWQAAMDGGSLNNVGSAVSALTSGYGQRFFSQGSNDSGRVVQLVAVLTNADGASAPAEIREVQLNYDERPTMVPAYNCVIRAEDYPHEGGISDDRSALKIRQDLEALVDGTVVTVVDPWGVSFTGRIAQMHTEISGQKAGQRPQERIPIQVRRLDYA